MKRFEQVPHTADLAAKVFGRDIPELFENAAYAMFSLNESDTSVSSEIAEDIELTASDNENLLVDWLNELLYLSESKEIIFSEFSVLSLNDGKLIARAAGQKTEETSEQKIKAATYHDLEIKKTDEGYMVTIVFDV